MLLNTIAQLPRFLGEWEPGELASAVSGLSAGAILAFFLYRFVRRVPWPRPFRVRFVLVHVAAAIVFALAWLLLSIAIESLFTGSLHETRNARPLHLREHPSISLLVYAVVVGVAYASEARARAALAREEAARSQLAALRAQLHPHFLFNALHTVVQLIPIDPARAAHAAEIVGSLLRATMEEERDLVPLDEEWHFVSRYLEVEHLRFGERLWVRPQIDSDVLDVRIPSFALQTLVENAVRHGAAHRVAPTEIVVAAERAGRDMRLSVRNTGDPLPPVVPEGHGTGTGLSRLRERLRLLYGEGARLTWGPLAEGGFEAVLIVPRGRSRKEPDFQVPAFIRSLPEREQQP